MEKTFTWQPDGSGDSLLSMHVSKLRVSNNKDKTYAACMTRIGTKTILWEDAKFPARGMRHAQGVAATKALKYFTRKAFEATREFRALAKAVSKLQPLPGEAPEQVPVHWHKLQHVCPSKQSQDGSTTTYSLWLNHDCTMSIEKRVTEDPKRDAYKANIQSKSGTNASTKEIMARNDREALRILADMLFETLGEAMRDATMLQYELACACAPDSADTFTTA